MRPIPAAAEFDQADIRLYDEKNYKSLDQTVLFRSPDNDKSIHGVIVLIVAFSACAMTMLSGCHRGYYRRQADKEAQRLIQEKSCDPRWNNSSDGTITIDPQSRMFDPFSQDHPPIPPDDPASHALMHCVDGHRGYPHWHANGDTSYVENPDWRAYLPINENGEVVLSLESAYQMALLHSDDLQTARETLYLSALDVSLERFGFDAQLFAGYNSFFRAAGNEAPGGGGSFLSSGFGADGGGFRWEKLGITGTQFAVGLANEIIWNFSGPTTRSAGSILDFSIIQPLLRGAGRDRIMEALTQAERNLLADVRALDRFRRGFYLNVVTGRNPGAGPRAGFLILPIGIPGGTNGYLGLLRLQQQIRIQEANVRQVEYSLAQFREFFARERINSLQVRQFEGSLYDAQETLLTLKTNYQTALDNFKRSLGIPPEINVVIEDDLLTRFNFISDEITQQQESLNQLRAAAGAALNQVDELCPVSIEVAGAPDFQWSPELPARIQELVPFLDEAERIIEELNNNERQLIEEDLNQLGQIRPERVKYLERLQQSVDRGEILSDVEPAILSADSVYTPEFLQEQLQLVLTALAQTQQRLTVLRSRIQNFESDFDNLPNDQIYQLVREQIETETSEILSRLYKVSFEMSLVQAKARSNSIGLPEVELDDELAFRIARCFRRDLMNARAALVDRWRRIEFFADELESRLDLVVDGGYFPFGEDPFQFSSANGQLRAGFRFDAPIVRLAERNAYRQALIDYQRARRDYYLFRDEIHANLRQILRELNLNKILFELSRQNIQVAIEQVDLAQLSLEDPSATELGATTARDLTSAILSLQNALNRYVSVWVDYEALRRNLDFDLGTFQLGPDMSWIDPGKMDDSIAARAAAMLGIDLEDECYCDIYDYLGDSEAEQMIGTFEGEPGSDPSMNPLAQPEFLELPAQPDWESTENN